MGQSTGEYCTIIMLTGSKLVLVGFLFFDLQIVIAQDYCSISQQHTMCKYQGPASDCNPIFVGVSAEGKEVVLNKHNELRRMTAKGNTPGQSTPSFCQQQCLDNTSNYVFVSSVLFSAYYVYYGVLPQSFQLLIYLLILLQILEIVDPC